MLALKSLMMLGALSQACYHPSGESTFSPVQAATVPRSRGRIGTRVSCLTRMARFSPADEAFKPPRPATNVAKIANEGNTKSLCEYTLSYRQLVEIGRRAFSRQKAANCLVRGLRMARIPRTACRLAPGLAERPSTKVTSRCSTSCLI